MRFDLRCASLLAIAVATPAIAQDAGKDMGADTGLLFRASADKSLTADVARGDPVPNFRSNVNIVPDGAIGGAARWADDGYVAWKAPGNFRAQRGTLSFFWRPREPLGQAPFVLFRTGFADHTSWDMAFLRIDWNGHGFDAFVTDANLSRIRVSWTIAQTPAADAWKHIAFAWDETKGVVLFIDGKPVARKDQVADLDSGLDQFGLAGRVISPHQVQSRYHFMRGSDLDEIRVYDHMLRAENVAALADKREPSPAPPPETATRRTPWLHRYGWDKTLPPLLDAPVTTVRKVEFADAKDLKEWMWKGVDGIAETTWPGVYNRSKLPGRDDYFELPDWNVYVEGGKRYDLTVPPGERFNRVEIRGAAYGSLLWSDGAAATTLATRAKGIVRSVTTSPERQGGTLSFVNTMQEQPIQELWAYHVHPGAEPAGRFKLSYTIDANASTRIAALAPLTSFIAGRYAREERSTVVALPSAGIKAAVGAGAAGAGAPAQPRAAGLPIVHVLIPASLGDAYPDAPLARAFDYGWQNLHDGLDGVAIDLPALKGNGPIALNIRVKDPIWPARDMIDLSVAVRPGEARTLWLDLRDRILSNDSLYLSIASSDAGFDAASLNGAKIRLVFKDRAAALPEHIADRLNQVKDNWGYLVEEHTASKREALYARVFGDIGDLLRVDPDNVLARQYWADINYRPENMPAFVQPAAPAGVPLWAFRQLEDLKLTRQFVDWWIDHRQVPYGDFGGGISDDTDLTQQWPGLALMGVQPDKINASLRALSDAVYTNGMRVNGLGYITTDELHAYEEGLNSDAERLYLNWGEPIAVERLMATAKALQGVILKNPAGHMHFASNWYGGRVEQPNEILQRERLGGIALKRNQTWPGNTVSWRFAEAGAAEQVAILLPNATPTHFRVLGYNTSATPQAATMTAWNVTAGRWTMTRGTTSDDGRTVTPAGAAEAVTLERSASVPVAFAPGAMTVYDFALVTPSAPVEARPDLGIGRDDIRVEGRTVRVTVHSLGAVATPQARVSLWGDALLASVPLAPLAAPSDLLPRTATVTLTIPAGRDTRGLAVHVDSVDGAAEVTQQNNRVALADRAR